MNGEFQELYSEIDRRVTILETKMQERWKVHNEQALENRKLNAGEFAKLFLKLDNLPCKAHIEKFKGIEAKLNLLSTIVIIVIIGGIVLGVWMNTVTG